MNSKKNFVKLIVSSFVSLSINGCKTPGIEEPDVLICSIIQSNIAECFDREGDSKGFYYTIDMIGWQCVSPEAYADLKTHHQILHRELNQCKESKGD